MTIRAMYKELYHWLPEEELFCGINLENRRIKLKQEIRRENRRSRPELQSLQNGAHHFAAVGFDGYYEYWITDMNDEDAKDEISFLNYHAGVGQEFCRAYWYRLSNGKVLIRCYHGMDI